MARTEKDFATFVTIDGVTRAQLLEAAGFEGGAVQGDDTSIHEPGKRFPTALGGLDEIDTVKVFWWWSDDIALLSKALIGTRGTKMTVARHKRNNDLSIVAAPFKTYVGIVHTMTDPNHDSGSSSETKFEVEMQVEDVK